MREKGARVLHPHDLFALRHVHDARLSPDGARVAYVISRTDGEPMQERVELAVDSLGSGSPRTILFAGRIAMPRWSPDGRHLAFLGTEAGTTRLYIADEQRHVRAITPVGRQAQGPISWSPDGTTIAYTSVENEQPQGLRRITTRDFRVEGIGFADKLRQQVCLVDVATGASRALDLGLRLSMHAAFSPCGKRLLLMGADKPVPYSVSIMRGVRLLAVDLATGRADTVMDESWTLAFAAWTPDGERVVVAATRDTPLPLPNIDLWVVNRDGSNATCRTAGSLGNVGLRIHHDMPTWGSGQSSFLVADRRTAFATVTRRGCGEIWRVALDGPVEHEPVVSGPRTCLLTDVNGRTGKLTYCVSDLHGPWELNVSDLDGRNETRITRFNDEVLSQWPRLQVDHFEFHGADGLPLEAWHVSRADRKGAAPTVMFIHGGPYHSTGNAYRYDFHLLAANGIGVLTANFRGSSGYGEEFARKIMGRWGELGFPDHMAAVDAAVARGLAYPDRLGVWGASHGGFATNWIVGHTTRFRAAVAESSVSNLATMYYLSDGAHLFAGELGGRPDQVPDVYRERSPLTYAANARTPTLLLHGADDLRCPLGEAEQFYRALHDAGCDTELVIVEGMNHMGDSAGPLSARSAQNEALLEWFERHL